MKIYEIRVVKVTSDYGRFDGYENIGYTVDKTIAEKIAKDWAKENEVNQWWMCYDRNREGHIRVEVVELGEIIEKY